MDLVLFGCFNQEKSPATADVQKGHTFFQIKFLQYIVNFVYLSLI